MQGAEAPAVGMQVGRWGPVRQQPQQVGSQLVQLLSQLLQRVPSQLLLQVVGRYVQRRG